MFGQSTYLIYVLVFCLIPIALLWATNFPFLRRNLKVVGLSALIMFVYLCATDPFAEAWHTWFFSSDRILGWYVINFPVEEALFFLLVPIAIASATLSCLHWLESARQKTV